MTSDIRKQVVDMARTFLEYGLVVRTWGNFSGRIDDDHFVVTPSGKGYETMAPEDLVLCTLDGVPCDGEHGRPSSEAPMHGAVYRRFPDIRYAAHTHQMYASAMSLMEETPSVPLSPYAFPGSPELHRNVEAALERTKRGMVLLERHGAFVVGTSPQEVMERAMMLETVGQMYWTMCVPSGMPRPRESIDRNTEEEQKLMDTLLIDRPFVVSRDVETLYWSDDPINAYLDDFAQICGIDVGETLGDNNVFVDRAHGCAVCVSDDVHDAYNVRAVLEKNARAQSVGRYYDEDPLPMEECRRLRAMYRDDYGRRLYEDDA